MIRKYKGKIVAVLALAVTSSAFATDPAIDLSAAVTGVTDLKTAVISVAPTVIAAAFGVFAIKWGVGFVIGLFKKAGNKG